MPSNCDCSILKILYSMLMGVSAVKGSTSVKKMRDASVCICRLCAVVTVVRGDHLFLKFRTSRRKIVFSAVNSRDAVQSIKRSMWCSMLYSSAFMQTFAFDSLVMIDLGVFSEVVVDIEAMDSLSLCLRAGVLMASSRGITIRTC